MLWGGRGLGGRGEKRKCGFKQKVMGIERFSKVKTITYTTSSKCTTLLCNKTRRISSKKTLFLLRFAFGSLLLDLQEFHPPTCTVMCVDEI